jgi:regulator of RNase E activity RraB
VNFAFRGEKPDGADTLYYAGLQILEPGDHGMGVEPDAGKLRDLEDAITDSAAAHGFTFVGRLRNHGDWQLTFYGSQGREQELEELVVAALEGSDRGYRVGSKSDPGWSYYDDFLLPDAERWQWIMDRRVVEQLAEHGDHLETARPVDHFVEFSSAKQRDEFVAAARERGFAAEEGESEDGVHSAELVRLDPVTLEHIHRVVMELVELAEAHGGDYDGWGAPIAGAGTEA